MRGTRIAMSHPTETIEEVQTCESQTGLSSRLRCSWRADVSRRVCRVGTRAKGRPRGSGLALSPPGVRALLPRYRRVSFARHHRQSSHSDAALRAGGEPSWSSSTRLARTFARSRAVRWPRGGAFLRVRQRRDLARAASARWVFRVADPVQPSGLAGAHVHREERGWLVGRSEVPVRVAAWHVRRLTGVEQLNGEYP